MISGLVLEIHDSHCTCGNKWVTSRPILLDSDGGYGGTPTPRQEKELPVVRIYATNRDYGVCFRCGPLALNSDAWQKLKAAPPAPAPAGRPASPPESDPFNFAQELGLVQNPKEET